MVRDAPGRPSSRPTLDRFGGGAMSLQRPHSFQVALVEWLDERYPFSKSVAPELYPRRPHYAASMYYDLGRTLFLLVAIQVVTGFLLGLYYVPHAVRNPAP